MPAGNNFVTHDGSQVGGAVAMALNDKGEAVPVGADTPIGAVEWSEATLEKFCRALAAHVVLMAGGKDAEKNKDAMEKTATAIMAFAGAKK
jgi:hypothetical protein